MSSSLSQWVWAVLINILGEKCCLVNAISVVFTCSNDINKRIPLSLVNQFPVCHYICISKLGWTVSSICFLHLFMYCKNYHKSKLWLGCEQTKNEAKVQYKSIKRFAHVSDWYEIGMQFKSSFPCSLIIIASESGANGRTMMSLCYWRIIGGAHDLNSQ